MESPLRALDWPEGAEEPVERVRRSVRALNIATAWNRGACGRWQWAGSTSRFTVDMPWRDAEFEPGMAPSLLLRSEYLRSTTCSRDEVMAKAVSWCEQRAPLPSPALMPVGALARPVRIELCRAMIERAWVCGFLSCRSHGVGQGGSSRGWWSSTTWTSETRRSWQGIGGLARSATRCTQWVVLLAAAEPVADRFWDSASSLRAEAQGALPGAPRADGRSIRRHGVDAGDSSRELFCRAHSRSHRRCTRTFCDDPPVPDLTAPGSALRSTFCWRRLTRRTARAP